MHGYTWLHWDPVTLYVFQYVVKMPEVKMSLVEMSEIKKVIGNKSTACECQCSAVGCLIGDKMAKSKKTA